MKILPVSIQRMSFTFLLLAFFLPLFSPLQAQQEPPQVRIVEVRRQALLKTIEGLAEAAHNGSFSVLRYQDNANGSRVGWPHGTFRRTVTYYYTPGESDGNDRAVYSEEEQELAGLLQFWIFLYSPSGDLQYARYVKEDQVTVLYYDARGDVVRYMQNGEVIPAPSLWLERSAIERKSTESKALFKTLRAGH